MKVRLYTAQDEFVKEFVKEVEINAHHTDLPLLVIWGSRYFILDDDVDYLEANPVVSFTQP